MPGKDCFSGYHPSVNLLYFVIVIGYAMFCLHPVSLAISLVCAATYSVQLRGWRAFRRQMLYLLPLMLLAAVLNPAFNHAGVTILTYLPTGNPLTLESIAYGLAAAVMLVGTITWFANYIAVMTSDKFVYLFGRVIPSLSLVLSMSLRFVPRFREQLRQVSAAQRGIGRDAGTGSVLRRARQGITILSIMITWCLESGIETADSMKSRGYGLPGRSAFSIYRFSRRDRCALLFLGLCGGLLVLGTALGGLAWNYFPAIGGRLFQLPSLGLYLLHLALGLMPVFLDRREEKLWRALPSKT